MGLGILSLDRMYQEVLADMLLTRQISGTEWIDWIFQTSFSGKKRVKKLQALRGEIFNGNGEHISGS